MKKKIGLALAGGGVRGAYQVGAFLAFKKCGIKFNAIAGTSIGSFNAAMLASHREIKLLNFWRNIDVSKVLELDPILKKEKIDINKITATLKMLSEKFQNRGFNIQPLIKELNGLLNEKKLRRSNIDFGLVTVKGSEPVKIFIKDMPKNTVADYIAASCYLPVFKREKLIDDSYYLDGGFVDNCPIQMLEQVGCQKIYAIRLKSIGSFQHQKNMDTEVIYVDPSKNLGSILAIDSKLINDNIKLGYCDTLKVLNKLDGREYSFKVKSKNYYQRIINKVDEDLLNKIEAHYKTKNPKKLIIRVLEYILRNEQKDVYHIYKPRDIIKSIKKQNKENNIQYNFVKQLKVRM